MRSGGGCAKVAKTTPALGAGHIVMETSGAGAGAYAAMPPSPSRSQQAMRIRIRGQKTKRSATQEQADADASIRRGVRARVKKRVHADPAREMFKRNLRLAVRFALGVALSGLLQTHASSSSNKEWLFLPASYYIGGLYYAATMVIFAAARNVGGVIERVWQIDLGVALALVYNVVLFAIIRFDYNDLTYVPVGLAGWSYAVSLRDWGIMIPFLLIFTFAMLISPLERNVKKFAVATNLYFMLVVASPMNPLKPTILKEADSSLFTTANLMKNLAIYSFVGITGTLISLLFMFFPYPLFAIRQLMLEMEEAPHEICEILNLIVDSYCFRAKDIKEMDFFRLRLERLMTTANNRLRNMERLLGSCWWEEVVGVGWWFQFNKSIAKAFIRLYAKLLKDLQAMKFATELETSHWTHLIIMKKLQKRIYVLQVTTNDLLEDISSEIVRGSRQMPAHKFNHLERKLSQLMAKYTTFYADLLSSQVHSPADVGKTMPLNLFLYSFHALTHTLFEFEKEFKVKNFTTKYRVKNFLKHSWRSVIQKDRYPRMLFVYAVRTTLAVFLGVCCSTFLFAFSSTTPNVIAVIAQFQIGATYGATLNRITGLVAGSVMPSIFNYFICKISSDLVYNLLNNVVLLVWITVSMYAYFAESSLPFAGMVSAFVSASVLLTHSCRTTAYTTATTNNLSYTVLTQNSIGIVILVVIEMLWQPRSAKVLFRNNTEKLLHHYNDVFHQVFRHHLAFDEPNNDSRRLVPEEQKALNATLSEKIPALLAEQSALLKDAQTEPTLWWPTFSSEKHTQYLKVCQAILPQLRILADLIEWHEKRRNPGRENRLRASRVSSMHTELYAEMFKVQRPEVPLVKPPVVPKEIVIANWVESQEQFEVCVGETLETLMQLCGEQFLSSSGDDNAIFMQMKEAFRIADVHRRGKVNASELAILLEKLLPYTAHGNVAQLDQYVEDFMQAVDQDHDGTITFEEFMKALDQGFSMELEIYEKANAQSYWNLPTQADSRDRAMTTGSVSSHQRSRGLSMAAAESTKQAKASFSEARGFAIENDPLVATIKANDRVESQAKTDLCDFKDYVDVDVASTAEDGRSDMSDAGDSPSEESSAEALLNVESFTIKDVAAKLKLSYGEYLLQRTRNGEGDDDEEISIEDFILMSCVICVAEEFAANLTKLNNLAAS